MEYAIQGAVFGLLLGAFLGRLLALWSFRCSVSETPESEALRLGYNQISKEEALAYGGKELYIDSEGGFKIVEAQGRASVSLPKEG